jgi:hypothetical protein
MQKKNLSRKEFLVTAAGGLTGIKLMPLIIMISKLNYLRKGKLEEQGSLSVRLVSVRPEQMKNH